MSNFIGNLISRHVAAANNVMPRLRGKYEPETNASNALPGDISSSTENFAEQFPASQEVASTTNKNDLVEKTDTGLLVNDANADVFNKPVDQPVNTNDQPAKQIDSTASEFSFKPLINKILFTDKQEQTEFPQHKETVSKENHLVITNQHKTINEELIINNEHTKEYKEIIATEDTPLKTKPVEPFKENKTFAIEPVKPAGLFGEPPALNNISKSQPNIFTNHVEESTTPVIKVTIGQIHVRAVTPPQVAVKKQRVVTKPSLSLEDYLKQRTKGQ